MRLKMGDRGFRIVYPHGYSLSVQVGYNHYCGNRDFERGSTDAVGHQLPESATAEIAFLGPNGFIAGPVDKNGRKVDDVHGWVAMDVVLQLAIALDFRLRIHVDPETGELAKGDVAPVEAELEQFIRSYLHLLTTPLKEIEEELNPYREGEEETN